MVTIFYIVWREQGGALSTKKHSTFEAAKAEAHRLALIHRGTFHILKLEASIIQPKPVLEYALPEIEWGM